MNLGQERSQRIEMCKNERSQRVEIYQNERSQRIEICQTADIFTNTVLSTDCICAQLESFCFGLGFSSIFSKTRLIYALSKVRSFLFVFIYPSCLFFCQFLFKNCPDLVKKSWSTLPIQKSKFQVATPELRLTWLSKKWLTPWWTSAGRQTRPINASFCLSRSFRRRTMDNSTQYPREGHAHCFHLPIPPFIRF